MAVKKFSDLFAFDLDGTLVHGLPSGERGIPPALLKVVHKLADRAAIVVATGRRYRSAYPDILTLPKMPYSILHNGLVIKDQKGKTIFRRELSTKNALVISKILEKKNVDFFFSTDAHEKKIDFIFLKNSLENSASLQTVYERTKGVNRVFKTLDDLIHFKAAPLVEITSVAPHKELLKIQKSISRLLPRPYRVLVVKNIGFSKYGALEIFPKTCSKWTGIEFVRKRLGARRVIAVGDDENDMEMIKSAHIGLVMSHAQPHVKAVSQKHIKGHEGLRTYLKEFYSL
ncbi:MAG: hydrolase-like protein superfamily type 3 [Bacteriovoracaceae bacterium]|nr:hydrolase-like protein superfamily type 3 [Bacteriovoracaceae bacterium]